jgi:hypothetical protein
MCETRCVSSHFIKVKILPKETEAVGKRVLLEKLILDFHVQVFFCLFNPSLYCLVLKNPSLIYIVSQLNSQRDWVFGLRPSSGFFLNK